jgi:hypothetical protein
MSIIIKSGLINKNDVPLHSRNATIFFSQQVTNCFSHPGILEANKNTTRFVNSIRILFEANLSVTGSITVSYNRKVEVYLNPAGEWI